MANPRGTLAFEASDRGPERARARRGAVLVKWGFDHYRSLFRRITRRAERRFEAAEWRGADRDMRERLTLYGRVVRRVVRELGQAFRGRAADEGLWSGMKSEYAALVAGRSDVELAETFFNSVTRKVFPTIGVNPAREFVRFDGSEEPPVGEAPVRTYPGGGASAAIVRRILDDYAFSIPWLRAEADARLAAAALDEATTAAWGDAGFDFIEALEPLFFRSQGAYLVGRVVRDDAALPLVVAILNQDGRARIDAVVLTEDEASIVFSFTRSYFHVDIENPSGTVRFLRRILPRKPVAELYNAIGFDRHGKTVLYRELQRRVESSDRRFEYAPGDRGLVMIVFAMPGFDIVFKVLRDRFGPGKTMSRDDVRKRYRFVATHDRAGRLVDFHEFEHLALPAHSFEPALLDELLAEAPSEVRSEDGTVVLRRVYTERRVTPLNLHLRDADAEEAERTVLDFGDSLRDLAATNVFPGDLPIKNFGVTRHGRVVFYDYDELRAVTECDFRSLPDVDFSDGEDAPFYAGPRDVFPEEFARFLGLPRPLRDLFEREHAELLGPEFWNRTKSRHLRGDRIDVFPYRPERRLTPPPKPLGGNSA